LVVPVVLLPIFDSLWVAVALISLATFAHQGWASNVFTLVSDYFPKQMIGTMTSLAGFCGSVGGVLAAAFVGNVLEITHSYFLVFLLAGSSYLIAWLFLQLFLPKETVTAT
jgi:MFS transporter, ACS family, hexuronate transporter